MKNPRKPMGDSMKLFSRLCRVMLCILLILTALPAFAQSKEKFTVVVNGESESIIKTEKGNNILRGRISGHLSLTKESLEKGVITAEAFNWVLFGVDQESITEMRPKGKATSALGFSITPGKMQELKYTGQEIRGKLQGQLSMDQFFELTPPKERGEGDDLDMLTMPTVMEIIIPLEHPLQPSDKGVETLKSNVEIAVYADAYEPLHMKAVEITSEAAARIEIDWYYQLEVARSLCIQPVRIGSFHKEVENGRPRYYISLSGDGLAFGRPGMNTEWAKADIVFNVRDWITIYNNRYSSLTKSDRFTLFAEVNEDDCIEVFFVDKLDDPAFRDEVGGGETNVGGTASAKIYTSDENADFGVDLTHLAHEVGHVLTLKHPGEGFNGHRIDGSASTLMCKSGFGRDNPRRNSQWNADKASNPLLTFALKLPSAGPDCSHSDNTGSYVDDCGDCP